MTSHEPGYDFFGTAPSAAPSPSPEPPAAAPVVATTPYPVPTPVPAVQAPLASPLSGYAPGSVNQFGTPLDTPVVPTGPYAAPGIGAAPVAGPALVSEADRPATHRLAAREPTRPGTVLAAGIVGIVVGALGLLLGLVGMVGYAGLRQELSALESSSEAAGLGALDTSGLTALILVGVLVLLASGAGYLTAGIATVAGRRWGAWTLLVVSGLSIAVTLLQMVTAGDGSGLLGIAVSSAVVALLLAPASRAWLRGGS